MSRKPDGQIAIAQLIPHIRNSNDGGIGNFPSMRAVCLFQALQINRNDLFAQRDAARLLEIVGSPSS